MNITCNSTTIHNRSKLQYYFIIIVFTFKTCSYAIIYFVYVLWLFVFLKNLIYLIFCVHLVIIHIFLRGHNIVFKTTCFTKYHFYIIEYLCSILNRPIVKTINNNFTRKFNNHESRTRLRGFQQFALNNKSY